MLVLSRKPDETLRIGDDITLTVISIEGGTVRLGIDAPKAVPVHRGEVYDRIHEENRRSAGRPVAGLKLFAKHWLRKKNRSPQEQKQSERTTGSAEEQ